MTILGDVGSCVNTKKNRSEISIIVAMLEAVKDESKYGATQTKIMYKAFLNYEQLNQYLPILKDNDMLQYDEETRTLKITEKGLKFLQIYNKIRKMTTEEESVNKVSFINTKDDDEGNKSRRREKGGGGEANPEEIKIANLENNSRYKPSSAAVKLLLVDDDSDIVEVLKQGLEANGFLVDAFRSSRKALNAFQPDVYDLAILDIRMPYLNGFELYREMKKRDPAITTCFLSAFEIYPEEFEKVFPSLDEIKTIIKKPVSIHHLVREIRPLLRMSAIRRASRGEHLVVAFDTVQELIEQSLHFLKTGLLQKGEDILLITDELPKDAIREKIAKEWDVTVEDVSRLEQEGRIRLRTLAEWYLVDNRFDTKRSKVMMAKMAQKALEQGRKGLRIVNDANAFFSTNRRRHLVVLESSLEKQFELPITLLCVYSEENIRQLNDFILTAIIQKNHNRMMRV